MMKKMALCLLMAALFYGCSSISYEMRDARPGFEIVGVADDESYGYTQENPVKVGGATPKGPANEHDYLYALRGPEGQNLYFRRLGSCCHFETPNGFRGVGLLDQYEVSYPGITKPVILYINMYDYEAPKSPVGFTYVGYGTKI